MGVFERLDKKILDKAARFGVVSEDIVESFVRGGGKGGQKINKTSSCVVLKHLSTGIEVRCQKHREQYKNRLSAYKLLINKVEDFNLGKKSERMTKVFKLRKQKKRRGRRAKEKMLKDKQLRGKIKEFRKSNIVFDD